MQFLKYSTTLNADMQTKVKEAICARAEELVTKVRLKKLKQFGQQT
jgi:hypothetical protein